MLQEKNGGKVSVSNCELHAHKSYLKAIFNINVVFQQGSDSSRHLQDTADTVLSSLNQPSTSQPTSLLATKLLETSSVKLGNETVKNENSDMVKILKKISLCSLIKRCLKACF